MTDLYQLIINTVSGKAEPGPTWTQAWHRYWFADELIAGYLKVAYPLPHPNPTLRNVGTLQIPETDIFAIAVLYATSIRAHMHRRDHRHALCSTKRWSEYLAGSWHSDQRWVRQLVGFLSRRSLTMTNNQPCSCYEFVRSMVGSHRY